MTDSESRDLGPQGPSVAHERCLPRGRHTHRPGCSWYGLSAVAAVMANLTCTCVRLDHMAEVEAARSRLNATPWWRPLKRNAAGRDYRYALYRAACWELLKDRTERHD